MKFIFEIAKRYLLGKKSTNAINVITWISVIGITIGTAALIIILSVFNGFETLLSGLYNSFNPDLKIIPIEGKYFEISEVDLKTLKHIEGIEGVSRTIEEVALFEYKEVQKAGIIKGVDDQYSYVTSIDSTMRSGSFTIKGKNDNFCVLGRGLSVNLSINYKDNHTPIAVHMPVRNNKSILNQLGKEFKTMRVYPSGIFSVGSDADVQYIITNFEATNQLLSLNNQVSALEIKLAPENNEAQIIKQITAIIGNNYKIKNRYQQDEAFLKVMNIEKWISYLIAILTLIIIAFNMVGSLWMMVLEKKKDISILRSMGCNTKDIRNIFFMEGIIITVAGIVLGTILALVLYVLQKHYDLVTIPEGFMISAYPIELKWTDFVIVIFTVLSIGAIASLLPSYRAGKVSAFVRQEI